MNDEATNVVKLRFETFDEAKANEVAILEDFEKQWNNAFELYDGTLAKIAADQNVLAKSTRVDVPTDCGNELRKFVRSSQHSLQSRLAALQANAVALKQSNSEMRVVIALEKAKQDAVRLLKSNLDAAVKSRDARLYGATAIAKRSLRFARANPLAFYGKSDNEHR